MTRDDRATRWLLASGIVGPVGFVVVFLILGSIRPDYDPLRVFVSLLSLGDKGWLQVANFLISGLLIIAFAFGLRRVFSTGPASRFGPITVGLVGLGLVIAGIFSTDPVYGYPPGTPPGLPQNPSVNGLLHVLGALFLVVGLAGACLVVARRFQAGGHRGWAFYSVMSGVAVFVFYGAASQAAPGPEPYAGIAGLLQRVSIIVGFVWLALLAGWLLRGAVGATTTELFRPVHRQAGPTNRSM